MATYIKTLKEDNGDITYPQTTTDAVLTTSGTTLETELGKCVKAEEIGSTAGITPTITTAMIKDSAVTTSKLADGAVTSNKIDWGDFSTYKIYSSNSFTVSSTTMTDKMSLTGLPAGKYLILLSAGWCNYDGGANGECNMRCYASWGSSTAASGQIQQYIPNIQYASCLTVDHVVWSFSSEATVKMQCSVNWPSRGTYTVNQASIVAIRLPY